MAQIIKFPVQPAASKFGYTRAKRRARASRAAESPDQLQLFAAPAAKIITLSGALGVFEQALLLDERGEAQAEQLYRRAIEEEDCIADAYCNLGIIQSRQGDPVKAFDSFTTSLKHNPRHFESHYNLGNVYFDLKDYRLAQIHYQMAVGINPTFPNVYFNLALVLAISHDLAAAVQALSTYQSLVPETEGRHASELLDNLKRSLAARHTTSGSAV